MRSPRLLYGHADTSMALLAGRVGFRRTTVEFGDEKTEILGATPEAVKSKVFGEEMRYCEYLLERRLTRAGIDHENWYF
jgi:hypothetical protein